LALTLGSSQHLCSPQHSVLIDRQSASHPAPWNRAGALLAIWLAYRSAVRRGAVQPPPGLSWRTLSASITSGQLEVAGLDREDWERIAALVTTYAILRARGTDASLIALAERLGATRIVPSTTGTSRSSGRAMPRRSSSGPDGPAV
jgi:hypothetical protein